MKIQMNIMDYLIISMIEINQNLLVINLVKMNVLMDLLNVLNVKLALKNETMINA
jgi:hypothetical protein